MTLNTSIRVMEPMAAPRLAEFCHAMVGGKGPLDLTVDYDGKNPRFMTEWGVGNNAHLNVTYGANGPLIEDFSEYADEEDYEPPPNPAFIDLDFDTTYRFHEVIDGVEMGCERLHATYIATLAAGPLSGVRFFWQNEFTGEWFEWGTEGSVDALLEFARAQAGSTWFTQVVEPILGRIIEGQS